MGVAYTQVATADQFIKNAAGTATAANFNAAAGAVTNNIAPVVSTLVATGANTIEITYNAAIAASAANTGKAQWAIVVDGTGDTTAAAAVSNSKVTLTTTATLTAASVVTVAYTQVATADQFIKNAAGTATAANFDAGAGAVTNNIAPVVLTLVATGANTIEITYNAAIAASAANTGK